eukprot:jgi/Galph1/4882/GphlegSOOS_G3587.1
MNANSNSCNPEQSSFSSDISYLSESPTPDSHQKRNLTPEMLKQTIEYECTRVRSTKREQKRGKRFDSLKQLADQIGRLQMEYPKNGYCNQSGQEYASSRLNFLKLFQRRKTEDNGKSLGDFIIPRPVTDTEKKPPMPVISLLEECSRYRDK